MCDPFGGLDYDPPLRARAKTKPKEGNMKKLAIAAALAAVSFFVAFAALTAPAGAQHLIDPAVVYSGAVEYTNPSLDPADEIALNNMARLTQFAPDGQVDVPYGDFIAELLAYLAGVAGIAALWLLRRLPKVVVDALDAIGGITLQKRADELLELAIAYGVNTTANAARGKTLSLKVGNEVLERAFEYALRHAPGLVNKIGGLVQLREKIIARLDIADTEAFTAARPAIVEPLTVTPARPAPAAPAG